MVAVPRTCRGMPIGRPNMRQTLPALLAALVTSAIVPALAQQAPDPAQLPTLRASIDAKTWDDGGPVSNYVYRYPSEVFPSAIVRRAGAPRELTVRPRPDVADFIVDRSGGVQKSLRQYVESEPIDGFIVVHKGVIVFESYPRMKPEDRHLSFSVTKAFIGTLVGLMEDRKQLDLSQPLSKYLPELADSAWGPVKVRDVVDMASGIEGDENGNDAYADPAHKHYQLEAALGWQPRSADMSAAITSGDAYAYLRTLKSLRPPGTRWAYNSANTAMLGQLIERVTGKRLSDLISENIWSRMGAEGDALLLLNDRGIAIAHGGLAMTLRDLARFGLLFTKNRDRRGPIPETFIRRILKEGRPSLKVESQSSWMTHASYQWDQVNERGILAKSGFGGQGIYIDVNRDVVVAMFGTNITQDSAPPAMPVLRLVPALFPE